MKQLELVMTSGNWIRKYVKSFPIPKIQNMQINEEVFTQASLLDINMG